MLKNNNFSKRLEEERNRLGHTQETFAQVLGISRKTASNYETGQYKTPLFEMAQSGVDVTYVITGIRMSSKCLLELQKGLENGDDWKPSRKFIISMVKQYLSYLEDFEELQDNDG
ncbi:MAG: helix-turn-helix domain-containing protein [Candidatus Parabeggiatoa sp.]|nr:helix-turn-helix domain-containing protein [Candidatus Parabeggiatoa sp.]